MSINLEWGFLHNDFVRGPQWVIHFYILAGRRRGGGGGRVMFAKCSTGGKYIIYYRK